MTDGTTARLLITSGRGPQECELVVRVLADRLREQARRAGITAKVDQVEPGEHRAGARSIILSLNGAGAANLAQQVSGPTCWQSPSPLRPQHRRKNWFVEVTILDDAPIAAPAVLERDVRFEPVRASGPGGQHRNKVSTGVRATHLPSGTVVVATDSRSAQANRRVALDRIADQLAQAARAAGEQQRHHTWQQHDAVQRGESTDQATHRIKAPLTIPSGTLPVD